MGVVANNSMQRRQQQLELQTLGTRSNVEANRIGRIVTVFDSGYFANGGEWNTGALAIYVQEAKRRNRSGEGKAGIMIVEVDVPNRHQEKPLYCVLEGFSGTGGLNGNGAYLQGKLVTVTYNGHAGYSTHCYLTAPAAEQLDPAESNSIASIGGII